MANVLHEYSYEKIISILPIHVFGCTYTIVYIQKKDLLPLLHSALFVLRFLREEKDTTVHQSAVIRTK